MCAPIACDLVAYIICSARIALTVLEAAAALHTYTTYTQMLPQIPQFENIITMYKHNKRIACGTSLYIHVHSLPVRLQMHQSHNNCARAHLVVADRCNFVFVCVCMRTASVSNNGMCGGKHMCTVRAAEGMLLERCYDVYQQFDTCYLSATRHPRKR